MPHLSVQCQYILKPFPLRNRRVPFPSFLYHLQCPRPEGCLWEKRLLGCVELFGEWSLVEFDILWLSKVVLGNSAQVCCILEHCRSHSHTLPLQQAVSFPLVHLLSKTGVFTKIKRLSAISGESLTALYVDLKDQLTYRLRWCHYCKPTAGHRECLGKKSCCQSV